MPLPPPAARQHLHTRAATYRGYLRDDGLWDIEAEMADTKTYVQPRAGDQLREAGEPIHGMAIRITLDEGMTIRAIAASMDATPFGECRQGEDPMQKMVGVRLGPGWRQAIDERLGGVRGCTHLRELLFNMATAAYQTVFPYRQLSLKPAEVTQPPHHLDRCIAWDLQGTVVQRTYPQFARKAA
ncbi:DUF2889 domain-containing protein [Ramlibacter albus]|uniref:DUF2889 domain-containing protein n=1 Tax=Ramlibacter albus TaxID=2079448 RepID=A0A923S1D5_9BURK|nr:DUF2889 domain-containing protein [Ramlibacter albus]MBC5764166.1 DUF2889 domain-containing protein [Ramlibacter albus]